MSMLLKRQYGRTHLVAGGELRMRDFFQAMRVKDVEDLLSCLC
jgi:hypothetical protein